jgi:hypothetical protein
MQNQFDPRTRTTGFNPAASVGVPRAARDAGLRSYMLSVYNYMASGVLLTGIIALLFAPYAQGVLISASGRGLSGLGWLITLSPLGFVFAMSFGVNRMRTSTLQLLFWAFAAVMGLSMSTLFLVFTGVSIAQTFLATAGAYLGLSLYGYTTKRDLTAMGKFLFMGLIGLILAGLVNMIWPSGTMSFIISAAGVLIFSGLIAYDTQKIKEQYADAWGTDTAEKVAIFGALSLYLDFVNLFQFLMSFLGQERE